MRILMTSYELPPVGGGGGVFADRLARELVQNGHHVDLVTMGFAGLPSRERKGRLSIHRVHSFRKDLRSCRMMEAAFYAILAMPTVARLCRRNRYNIVHSHFIFPDGIIGLWAQIFSGVPFIITAHGTDVPYHNPDRARRMHLCLLPLWRLLTRRAASVVCPSRYLNSLVLESNGTAITNIIPNGISLRRLSPAEEKTNRILVVCRMIESKGIQFLLQALVDLQIDYEVVLVGDGPYIGNLIKYACKRDLPVQFTGWIENDSRKLKHLYETSRIFVFPSETENCPLVLLEAMAAGLAIITTQGTGCSELIGQDGLLVPPRDPQAIRRALTKLVSQPAQIEKLGAAARTRLENFYSWQAISSQYQELYQQHAR